MARKEVKKISKRRREIRRAVKKALAEYRETLILLGKS